MDDISNLSDTVTSNGQQLNADDLISADKIITVTGIKRSTSKQQPLSIDYYGMQPNRPFKPCLTMRKILFAEWGTDGRQWVGKSMKLYRDPEVKFGTEKTGGIRISHLSDIDKQAVVHKLLVSKTQRQEFVINKLPTYQQAEFDQKAAAWIEAIKSGKITLDQVIEKASATGVLTATQIEFLKGAIKDA